MKTLIIGGDAAGMSAAAQIKRRRPDWAVTVLERGSYTSYAACGIPYYLAGDVEAFRDLVVVTPEEFRSKRGIDVRIGWEAESVDLDRRRVAARTEAGLAETLEFDRLLFATGASPVLPRWEGVELEGVMAVRNLHDAERFTRLLAGQPRRAVIVGAGYVGLEMAEALRRRGLDVVMVEKLDGVMGGAGGEITDLALEELNRHGVEVRLGCAVQGFQGQAGKLQAVETGSGALEADLAVLSLGVRPNVSLAADAGVPLGESGAIRVDVEQRTGVPEAWAAGDCAEANHLVLGRPAWIPLALTANRQGRVAGANIAGGEEKFPGIVGSAVTRVFDLTLARTGIDEATARHEGIPFDSISMTCRSKAHYFPGSAPLWVQIVFRSDNRKVLGGWLVGRDESAGKRADILATAISAGMTVDQVADLDLSYAPPFAPVWDPILQAANKARFRRAQGTGQTA